MGNNLACISQPTAATWATAAGVATQTYQSSTTNIRSGAVCLDYCTTEYTGARLLYDQPNAPTTVTGVECYCFNNELAPSNIVDSQNSDGNCVLGDVKYIKRTTTFNQLLCTTLTSAPALNTVSTIPECFFQCRGSPGAGILYTGPSATTFQCFCGTAAIDTTTSCQAGSYYIFNHQNYPQSSGMARRSLRDRKELARRSRLGKGGDMEYCPAGLSACKVAAGVHSGYECVDTSSELESCGGCAFGLYGGPGHRLEGSFSVDCTTMSGVPLGGSTCVNGRCIAMACEEGLHLAEGACLAQMD